MHCSHRAQRSHLLVEDLWIPRSRPRAAALGHTDRRVGAVRCLHLGHDLGELRHHGLELAAGPAGHSESSLHRCVRVGVSVNLHLRDARQDLRVRLHRPRRGLHARCMVPTRLCSREPRVASNLLPLLWELLGGALGARTEAATRAQAAAGHACRCKLDPGGFAQAQRRHNALRAALSRLRHIWHRAVQGRAAPPVRMAWLSRDAWPPRAARDASAARQAPARAPAERWAGGAGATPAGVHRSAAEGKQGGCERKRGEHQPTAAVGL